MKFGRRLFLVMMGLGIVLASCGGTLVNSPLSREEKRIYRLDDVSIEVLPTVSAQTIKSDVEGFLGLSWRYWLFGYRPLTVRVEIHDVSTPSSSVQKLFGSRSRMTTRIVIADKTTGVVLDDFTRVTEGGYEGLDFGSSQEENRETQRRLAELFVDEFRLMFYFGLN